MRARYDELLILGEQAVGADDFERAVSFFSEAEAVARNLGEVDLADRAFCNRCSVLVELDRGADQIPKLKEILLSSGDTRNRFLAALKEAAETAKIALSSDELAVVEVLGLLEDEDWAAEAAKQLGVEVERQRRILLVATSLMVGAAVSVAGLIGFVGLIIPHLLRLLLGPDHRLLVPSAALGGAAFLVLCDTVARTLLEGRELPVGAITALAGGPLFLYLLRRHHMRTFAP